MYLTTKNILLVKNLEPTFKYIDTSLTLADNAFRTTIIVWFQITKT